MGFFSKMLGQGIVSTVTGIGGVVNQFMETPDEKRAAEIVFAKLGHRRNEVQSEINKVAAGHRTLFVAGARPFLLWVCGIGLAFPFVITPILQWSTGNVGPVLPTDQIIKLVYGMLGLAGLRTYEKKLGITP